MTARQGTCPGCGAQVTFRWSQAVQAVCPYCRSVLVRTDLDLTRLGETAELPPTPSPIQLGTGGRWRGQAFTVVGRLAYAYERGRWNEWHLVLQDGTSAWLGDAQLELTVSRAAAPPELPADPDALSPGQRLDLGEGVFQVASITRAHYVGTEGELPFVYWDKREVPFVDCRAANRRFATIDYSETNPLLFIGDAVDVSELDLRGLREFEGW